MSDEPVKPLPFFYVGKEETQKRVLSYLSTKHKLLSEAIGKTDTKSIWYSRTHIEGLLDEMQHANADGLRIYLGSYPETQLELKNQTCLLMVMTRENPDTGAHADFDIEDEPDYSIRSAKEKGFEIPVEKNFNVGSPCPPICNGQEMKYS